MSRHRQDATPKAIRKFCPQCRYVLVQLSDFTGASSLDAPKSEVYRPEPISPVGDLSLIGITTFLLGTAGDGLLNTIKLSKRRKQIQRLHTDVLPADPTARVCPHCLHLVLSDE